MYFGHSREFMFFVVVVVILGVFKVFFLIIIFFIIDFWFYFGIFRGYKDVFDHLKGFWGAFGRFGGCILINLDILRAFILFWRSS